VVRDTRHYLKDIMTCRRRRVDFAQRTPVFGVERPASSPPHARVSPHGVLAANEKPPDGSGRLQIIIFKSLFLFLFFQGDGDRTNGREPHLVAFNAGNQPPLDKVVMALVRTFSAVLLGQLDPVALDLA
jgi:hypothetical protein